MVYYIYTDGSVKKNEDGKKVGGYGYVVFDLYGNLIDAYSQNNIENTTHNRMELTAILAALFMYEKRMRIKDQRANIYLYSDSEYALKSLFSWCKDWAENGWHTMSGSEVKNQDLIKNFYDKQWGPYLKNLDECKKNSWSRFNYSYIKGHNGIIGNELADKLATGQITAKDILDKDIKDTDKTGITRLIF